MINWVALIQWVLATILLLAGPVIFMWLLSRINRHSVVLYARQYDARNGQGIAPRKKHRPQNEGKSDAQGYLVVLHNRENVPLLANWGRTKDGELALRIRLQSSDAMIRSKKIYVGKSRVCLQLDPNKKNELTLLFNKFPARDTWAVQFQATGTVPCHLFVDLYKTDQQGEPLRTRLALFSQERLQLRSDTIETRIEDTWTPSIWFAFWTWVGAVVAFCVPIGTIGYYPLPFQEFFAPFRPEDAALISGVLVGGILLYLLIRRPLPPLVLGYQEPSQVPTAQRSETLS